MQLRTFNHIKKRGYENSWCVTYACRSIHSRTKLIRIAVIGLRGFSAAEIFRVQSFQFFPLHLYTGPMIAQTDMILLRLLQSINSTLNSMNSIYSQLTGIQSEVIAGEKNDRPEFKGVSG